MFIPLDIYANWLYFIFLQLCPGLPTISHYYYDNESFLTAIRRQHLSADVSWQFVFLKSLFYTVE